jgi:hypothetical protein
MGFQRFRVCDCHPDDIKDAPNIMIVVAYSSCARHCAFCQYRLAGNLAVQSVWALLYIQHSRTFGYVVKCCEDFETVTVIEIFIKYIVKYRKNMPRVFMHKVGNSN